MPHTTRTRSFKRAAVNGTGHRRSEERDLDNWLEDLGRRATVTPSGCWQVGDDPAVYPMISLYGSTVNAHRAVYQAVHEVVLDRYTHVHHTCETPACINPAHLVALSASEHMSLHARKRSRMWSSITTK